jgi:hypothetical protein
MCAHEHLSEALSDQHCPSPLISLLPSDICNAAVLTLFLKLRQEGLLHLGRDHPAHAAVYNDLCRRKESLKLYKKYKLGFKIQGKDVLCRGKPKEATADGPRRVQG